MNESLSKLQKLYHIDQSIKKEMIEISPPKTGLNTEGIIDYINQIHRDLRDIFYQLKDLSKTFSFEDSYNKKIELLEHEVLLDLYKSGVNINKLRDFYNNRIANMKQSLIESTKKNFRGYSNKRNKEEPLKEVTSINEMLHLMHFRVINYNRFLQSCNPITTKITNYNVPITTYGFPSKFLENVFNSLGENLDIGETTIVGVTENLIIMMVRDNGHALTIELKKGNSKTSADYFIPQVNNDDIVNQLPGVIPVKDRSVGTTGFFDFPNDELYQLGSFIERVPPDIRLSEINNKAK